MARVVHLTPLEREHAREILGISDKEYAEGKQRMADELKVRQALRDILRPGKKIRDRDLDTVNDIVATFRHAGWLPPGELEDRWAQLKDAERGQEKETRRRPPAARRS